MNDFDITSYCQNAGNETVIADCFIYNDISHNYEDLREGINVFFLLSLGALLFGRQAGFAMLNAGMSREKNVNNSLIKSLLDACAGSVAFWAIGYAFAFGGEDPNRKTFIGNQNFFLRDFRDGYNQLILFYFQVSFAQNSATVVTGVLAGRAKMGSYFFYSNFLTGFVYPVIAHNVWSKSGYLSPFNNDPFRGVGAIDFGGSGIVHVTGGLAALIAAILLGPRQGRFYDDEGEPLKKPGYVHLYSHSFVVLGMFLLWVGWLAYNPGSAMYATTPALATVTALAGLNTSLAACAGSLSAMLLDTFMEHRQTGFVSYDLIMACNGLLAGLVSISGSCALVPSWTAVIIGMVGGLLHYSGVKLLERLRIDDAVDAIPAHLFGGIWGLLATGLFCHPHYMQLAGYNSAHPGWFYSWARGSGDANLLLCEFCSLLYTITWVTLTMGPVYWICKRIGEFRVDEEDELRGLDSSLHGIMQEEEYDDDDDEDVNEALPLDETFDEDHHDVQPSSANHVVDDATNTKVVQDRKPSLRLVPVADDGVHDKQPTSAKHVDFADDAGEQDKPPAAKHADHTGYVDDADKGNKPSSAKRGDHADDAEVTQEGTEVEA